jgi:formylglycine-generating enzyme required for sulfatase activity
LQAANLVGWNGAAGHREFEKLLRAIANHVPLAKAAAATSGGVQPIQTTPAPPLVDLITIPPSTFWMGAQKTDKNERNYDPEALDNESPVHQVTLKAFRIARFPVTVQEYSLFLDSGGYQAKDHWMVGGFGTGKEPKDWSNQKNQDWPVVGVSWFEASAYCAWVGLRLPTEAEWERVARGPNSARYPWGDQPLDESRANYVSSGVGLPTTPQGHYPDGRSVEGIDDLLGNVWEWCSDWHASYTDNQNQNPVGPQSGSSKVLRGGSWLDNPRNVRVSTRFRVVPTSRNDTIGFRCAADA